jgi:hypothetical protein
MKKFNTWLAVKITKAVGSMWAAYLFTLISLLSLPAIIKLLIPSIRIFPDWLMSASLIALIAWISQNFIQLVLLPIIMVGQNVISEKTEKRDQETHDAVMKALDLVTQELALASEERDDLKETLNQVSQSHEDIKKLVVIIHNTFVSKANTD